MNTDNLEAACDVVVDILHSLDTLRPDVRRRIDKSSQADGGTSCYVLAAELRKCLSQTQRELIRGRSTNNINKVTK